MKDSVRKFIFISCALLDFIHLKAELRAFFLFSCSQKTRQFFKKNLSSPACICNYNQRRPQSEHIVSLCMDFCLQIQDKTISAQNSVIRLVLDRCILNEQPKPVLTQQLFSFQILISHIFSVPDIIFAWICYNVNTRLPLSYDASRQRHIVKVPVVFVDAISAF